RAWTRNHCLLRLNHHRHAHSCAAPTSSHATWWEAAHGTDAPAHTPTEALAPLGHPGNAGNPQPAGHRREVVLRRVSLAPGAGRSGAPRPETVGAAPAPLDPEHD